MGAKHSTRKLWTAAAGLFFGLICASAGAHEIRPAVVSASFGDGRYQIDIGANMEAVLAGVSPIHADTDQSPNARTYNSLRALPADALAARIREFMPQYLQGVHLEFDGVRALPSLDAIEVPPPGDLATARLTHVRLSGALPAGAQTFRWSYAAAYGSSVLRVLGNDGAIAATWLKDGVPSQPYPVSGAVAAKSRFELARDYVSLGFTHILPYGLDHILFVLGLFLLSTRWRPLLVQVTAFTIAHSITLGLTIYGVFSLSPQIVEPLIAASIVYVAVENVLTNELKPWRPVVVFGFGLLHGMGFAGVLQEVGLPRSEFLTGLITFNVGVELGQLAVIVLAYLVVGRWGRGTKWYRPRVVIPASVAIAATGAYWTVERIFV